MNELNYATLEASKRLEEATDKKTQEKVRKEMKKILDEQYERKRPISIVDKSSDEPPDSLADKKGKQE